MNELIITYLLELSINLALGLHGGGRELLTKRLKRFALVFIVYKLKKADSLIKKI